MLPDTFPATSAHLSCRACAGCREERQNQIADPRRSVGPRDVVLLCHLDQLSLSRHIVVVQSSELAKVVSPLRFPLGRRQGWGSKRQSPKHHKQPRRRGGKPGSGTGSAAIFTEGWYCEAVIREAAGRVGVPKQRLCVSSGASTYR